MDFQGYSAIAIAYIYAAIYIYIHIYRYICKHTFYEFFNKSHLLEPCIIAACRLPLVATLHGSDASRLSLKGIHLRLQF